MHLTRRELFKLITVSASGAAVLKAMEEVADALTSQANPPALIWLNDGGDDLNLLTLLGQALPRFLELVTVHWDVQEHAGILPTGYRTAGEAGSAAPIFVVERLPPSEAVQPGAGGPLSERLAMAKAAVIVGTDACYGGIAHTAQDVARFETLCKRTQTPLIKLPGVPTPPHHLVGVLAHLEFFGFPRLDAHRRPLIYYGETVCSQCERRGDLEAGRFARRFGEEGCLLRLGCKGPITHNTCPTARWNNGENWCVGAGGPCTGCSEPGFPDHGGVGLYGVLSGGAAGSRSLFWASVEHIGYGLLGLVGAGMALQVLRRVLFAAPQPTRAPAPRREEH
ncbi:MAG: hypothetical protein IIA40_03725 [SAR324 cluster bacterium]|nr:hypothetical protein [SAR324 cluster bacterium]